MNMTFDKTALRIISVFNCIAGGIILFLMLMTYAIGLFAVIGTWNLLEPDELIEVLEIGGCSLVLVIPGILMMGEGILAWMAVKDPSRIPGACILAGLMVGICAMPVALFCWLEYASMLYGSIGVLAASVLVFVFLLRERMKAEA